MPSFAVLLPLITRQRLTENFMLVDSKKVKDIAHLARIAVEDAKLEEYASNLSNILDMVAQMQAADTDNVLPMSHPLALSQRLRPDVVTETNQRDKFQEIAPDTESGLYLVPRVIE